MKGDVMLDPESLQSGTPALRSGGAQTLPPARRLSSRLSL